MLCIWFTSLSNESRQLCVCFYIWFVCLFCSTCFLWGLILRKTFISPSIGTPIILNLYLNETIKSVVIRNAKNSAPKVELSTVFWYWNTRLLMLNCNIKSSSFEISKLIYILNNQNQRKNWPELVLFLALGDLVEFPLQHQHANPSLRELYFEYFDHWWHVDNRDQRLYHCIIYFRVLEGM